MEVIKGPYPSVVLGSLASVEERSADIVVYVEDSFSESVVDPLISGVLSNKLGDDPFIFPKVAVVPIGGFREVVNFLKRHDALQRPGVRSYALLDADVKDESIENWRKTDNHAMLAWFEGLADRIRFLPWTPEVGLFDLCDQDQQLFLNSIKNAFRDQTLHFHEFNAASIRAKNGKHKRKACKVWGKDLIGFLCEQTARESLEVQKALGAILAEYFLESNRDRAMRDFAPMFG